MIRPMAGNTHTNIYAVYLEGEEILVKSAMHKTVAFLATEEEFNSGVSCAQDIMYALRVVESLQLQV